MPYALRPMLFALCALLIMQPALSQQIAIYPPQIHQQITPESTISRPLNVYNTGDEPLDFNCWFEPWEGSRDTTVSWVDASPMGGQIPPGDTAIIIFDFNSAGLTIQNYLVNFIISSNDTVNKELEVLAMLHVMDLNIFITPENDSIDPGDSSRLNVVVLGGSENYIYQWSSNPPGFHSTDKEPVVHPVISTYFILQVTDGGYSRKDSVYIKVTPSSGLKEENRLLSSLSVSPNPCRDHCYLSFESGDHKEGMISITNLAGQDLLIKEIDITKARNQVYLNTDFLLPGIYVLSVRLKEKGTTSGLVSVKLLKY